MNIFQKKPVYVEAAKFTDAAAAEEIADWIGEDCVILLHDDGRTPRMLEIRTPLGHLGVGEGYWVVKDQDGNFYRLTEDDFADTYSQAPVGMDEIQIVHRSAIDGKFVSEEEAKSRPHTTVTEIVPMRNQDGDIHS